MAYPDWLPEWAVEDTIFIDGTPNKDVPADNLIQYGYSPISSPNVQELNSLFYNICETLRELRTRVDSSVAFEFPIGSIQIMSGVSDNPSVLYGYGTWERTGQGKVLVGAGTGVDSNGVSQTFSDGDVIGEYVHKLTSSEMPIHQHTGGLTGPSGGVSAKIEGYVGGAPNQDNYIPTSTGQSGGDQAHNNIQPSFVVYFWRRVA